MLRVYGCGHSFEDSPYVLSPDFRWTTCDFAAPAVADFGDKANVDGGKYARELPGPKARALVRPH